MDSGRGCVCTRAQSLTTSDTRPGPFETNFLCAFRTPPHKTLHFLSSFPSRPEGDPGNFLISCFWTVSSSGHRPPFFFFRRPLPPRVSIFQTPMGTREGLSFLAHRSRPIGLLEPNAAADCAKASRLTSQDRWVSFLLFFRRPRQLPVFSAQRSADFFGRRRGSPCPLRLFRPWWST